MHHQQAHLQSSDLVSVLLRRTAAPTDNAMSNWDAVIEMTVALVQACIVEEEGTVYQDMAG
jgi:hypothetical protein